MPSASALLEGVIYFSLAVFILSFLGAFVRVVRGPSLPDRVMAVDLVAYTTMGFLGVYAILMQQPTYLDAALVLGVLIFLGTIAIARYIERRRAGAEERKIAESEQGAEGRF